MLFTAQIKKRIEVGIITGIILTNRYLSGGIFSSIEKKAYVNKEEHHAESLRYTLSNATQRKSLVSSYFCRNVKQHIT